MAYKYVSDQERDDSTETLTTSSEIQDEFDLDEFDSVEDKKPKRGWFAGGRGVFVGMVLGIVLAIVGTRLLPSKSAPSAAKTITTTKTAAQMSVTVAPVAVSSVARTLEATGTVAAYDMLPVLPQASGLQIKQVLADEGSNVSVGQILAVLDNSVLQSQLSDASAKLEAAQAGVQQKQAALGQAQAAVEQARAGLRQAQANVAQNQANLVQAQSNQKRYRQLAEQGAIPTQELETRNTTVATAAEALRAAQANVSNAMASITSAQANVSSAQANINSAIAEVRGSQARVQQIQTQLKQTQVLAPASGAIAERFARVGDISSANQKLFTIIRNGYLELQAKVPEVQLKEVSLGAPVIVSSNSDNRIRVQGKVREIAPIVDQQTRQGTVKIDLPANQLLRPGMFLQAGITLEQTQGLTVPAKAVLPQDTGKAIIYILEDENTARARPVEIGATMGGGDLSTAKIEIKTGLKQGDRVIVAGAGYLKDGDKVQVVSANAQQ
ncbi:MAG TPA: efflux RND transporter periplasmic adaptor subunit [Oculatellaceae cyanobacterium]